MRRKRAISPQDLNRIGAALYRGVSYNGRPAWQSWLAGGVGVDRVTVRRWLMEDKSSGRAVPEPVAILLLAAERACERLRMWEQPRGTAIADRMTDLALAKHAD
jgi:hypothetical protein